VPVIGSRCETTSSSSARRPLSQQDWHRPAAQQGVLALRRRQPGAHHRPVHPARGVADYVNSLWTLQDTVRRRRGQQLQRRPAAPGVKPLGRSTTRIVVTRRGARAGREPLARASHIHLIGPSRRWTRSPGRAGHGAHGHHVGVEDGRQQTLPKKEGSWCEALEDWKSTPASRSRARVRVPGESRSAASRLGGPISRATTSTDDVEGETKPPEQVKFEAHRRYIDIQLVVRVRRRSASRLSHTDDGRAYDSAKDIEFSRCRRSSHSSSCALASSPCSRRATVTVQLAPRRPARLAEAVVKVSVAYRDRQRGRSAA